MIGLEYLVQVANNVICFPVSMIQAGCNVLSYLGPVVRKVDSAIRQIAIFSNSLKLFIYWYKPD